jgi:hypothetical protein
VTAEAVMRARHLLAATSLLRELGLEELAADSRAVARIALDLADELDAERSARRALQAKADRLEAIVGKGIYYGCIAQAATDARTTIIAKQHITDPSGIEWPEGRRCP